MKRFIEIFFVFCFTFLFPIGEVIRVMFGNGVAINVFDVGLVLLLCWWISQNWMNLTKRKLWLGKPILIFIAACVLSLMVNAFFLPANEILIGSLYLFRWILYAGLYVMVANAKTEFKRKIPAIFLVCGGIVLLIGYIQLFFYPALRNLIYLGWDEHYQRIFGSFFDPNFLGAFLVLYLIFLLKIKNLKLKIILTVFSLFAIFLTFSRSAYIMFVVSIVTMLFISNKKKLLFILFGIIVIFSAGYFMFIKHPNEGMNLFRTTSSFARINSTQNAWKIFIDHPLFGVGFDTYRFVQKKYGFLQGSNWEEGHSGAGTDNSWLLVLGTTGIIGFATYVFMWWKILQAAWREKKENILGIIVFSSAIGLFINSFFINSLFYPFIIAWMWVLIGLTEKKKSA